MPVLLLSCLLLLLPPLLPAQVFLVETEAVSEEAGQTADSQEGQDYMERCRTIGRCGGRPNSDAYNSCLKNPKWTKRNDGMLKRREARREKGETLPLDPGGFWVMGRHSGKLLPKGSDRFCCHTLTGDAELVKNPRICNRNQQAAQDAKNAKEAEDRKEAYLNGGRPR